MTTIAYDRPVADFIGRLNATGHVTHKSYRKTSVTVHHNGGRLSHEGVLSVWKSRPASAHFDSDMLGRIAQYVKTNEYAWATGNTFGNQRTISIEMANSATGPSWTVADATWKSAARLAGWLFAKVIGVRPNSGNFFVHSHWSATACAGPYIAKIWKLMMVAAQAAYDLFTGGHVPPVVVPPVVVISAPRFPLARGAYFGPRSGGASSVSGYYSHRADLRAWQSRMAARGWSISADGLYGAGTAKVAEQFQAQVGLGVDGLIGPTTWAAAWTARIT